MNKILITGAAGFIGFHTSLALLKKKINVLGLDNLDNYYDISLKKKRLNILKKNRNFEFTKTNLINKKKIENIFKKHKINYVIHLAAQAGVRYSIQNPNKYIDTNIRGFQNILDCSKKYKIKHLGKLKPGKLEIDLNMARFLCLFNMLNITQ